MKNVWIIIGALVAIFILYCVTTYNGLVGSQEAVNQQWAQVQTVYQRRLDLIPNLVATVKGYAKHEQSTLLAVTEARAKATQIKIDMGSASPEQLKAYLQSQQQVSSSLSKLLAVVERYPDLKASQNFLALQNQLEGTENRISVERHRFNDAVKKYNVSIRKFPRVTIAHLFNFTQKPYYEADVAAATTPKVEF